MSNRGYKRAKNQDDVCAEEAKARRNFLKTVGQVAITTPAVTLLLSAKPRQAMAILSDEYGSTGGRASTATIGSGGGPYGDN